MLSARGTRLEFYRSTDGYGWSVTLHVRDKHRVRWSSRKATTPMWPGFSRGGDENCNRAVTVMLWPLGHLDVWWESNWRTDEMGPCHECQSTVTESFTCPRCGMTSHHPADVEHGYCGNCHDWRPQVRT